MANRVVITICGEEYTLVADETSAYMQKDGSLSLIHIKGYLDEASKAQAEVSELKREIFRLQQRLDNRK